MPSYSRETDASLEPLIGAAWNRRPPEGKIRWWCNDRQGGGWIEFITPEERAKREAILARIDRAYDEGGCEAEIALWNELVYWE